jgi:hypothetical protein
MLCGASPLISPGDGALPFEAVRTATVAIPAAARALGESWSDLCGVGVEHQQMSGERGRWSIDR